ncbi:SH3 domain-containing protein [Tolypocladium ophioglossoides CBS 100239]|uniref:SH3 domain-containing protein n=1 Tax=Tolypocladium ophioglossoides (strain CBS 100239) TaxID=1163406 RepID=A0A0L0NGH4_TOLOC|nr:SH3 domain-containing protein [Tolypocladium ophioglossoides CBS 100239]
MQRVSAFLPSWDKRNSSSNPNPNSGAKGPSGGFFAWGNRNSTASNSANPSRLPSRINVAAANADRIQREAFWPATLDLECDKAARILKSFCTDGYLAPVDGETEPSTSSTTQPPQTPVKVPKKIPKRIIQNAAGIAVFTCMRSGLWMTGSAGSGILIARKSDGTWSPPSGILLHTPTLSFIIGVDVYDCVLVINNLAALESITRPRVTLGEDVGLTNGPSVPLDSDEVHIKWKELGNTVLAYMKARGRYQAVNLHGCILTERGNENERFYGTNVTQMDILAGNVGRCVDETRALSEVIKMAEGRTDFDAAVIDRTAIQPAPGDAMIATPKSTPASPRPAFGIPKADDPDPFGVLALEMAGLEIREAGTHLRPTSSQFEFHPTPLSPSMSKFSRQSIETFVTRSNRASVMSSRTVKSQVTDACTQTDVANTPETTPSPGQSDDGRGRGSIERMPEVREDEEVDYTRVDLAPLRHLSQEYSIGAVLSADASTTTERDSHRLTPVVSNDDDDDEKASKAPGVYEKNGEEEEETNDADDEDDLDVSDDEEPVVFEVAAVQPTQTQAIASRVIHARGNMVTIAKRVPPPLPTRSPTRNSRSSKSEMGGDIASVRSPLRQAFSETDLGADEDEEQVTPSEAKAEDVETAEPVAQERMANETQSDRSISRELSMEDTVIEAGEIQEARTDETLDEKPKTVDAETCSSECELGTEEPVAAEPHIEKSESKDGVSEVSKVEGAGTSGDAIEEPNKDEDAILKEPQHDQTDNSDSTSNKRHTSSIYTGATEDRWSCDGSSLTTPTSERPYSMAEDATEEDTPTKKLTKEAEEPRAHEAHEQPSTRPRETAPSAVMAA